MEELKKRVRIASTSHCWERYLRTEDYPLKDCIQKEDLSALAHLPRLEL